MIFDTFTCFTVARVHLFIFTALHAMQMRPCDEKAVCLSIKCVDFNKTEERCVQIFRPYERSFTL